MFLLFTFKLKNWLIEKSQSRFMVFPKKSPFPITFASASVAGAPGIRAENLNLSESVDKPADLVSVSSILRALLASNVLIVDAIVAGGIFAA